MDNTFFDFVDAKFKACSAVLKHLGRFDEKEVMALVGYFLRGGKGIENLENISDYLKDHDLYTEDTFEETCEIYEQTKIDSIHTYEGVRETLEQLKSMGIMLAVVTDADKNNAMQRLSKTDLTQFFNIIITIEDTNRKKPLPDSILLALNRLNVKPEEALIVGDSLKRDIKPGKELGMVAIYAAYGDKNYFEERVEETDYTLNNIIELIDIVKNM